MEKYSLKMGERSWQVRDPRQVARRPRSVLEIAKERGGGQELMQQLGLTPKEFELAHTKPYFWEVSLLAAESGCSWKEAEYRMIAGMSDDEFELLLSKRLNFVDL